MSRVTLALFALLGVAPIVWGLVYALAYSLELTGVLAHGLTWVHWHEVLGTRPFWAALGFTFAIAFVVTGVAVVAALAGALKLGHLLDRSLIARVPLAFPAAVSALVVFSAFPWWIGDRLAIGILVAELFFAVPFLMLAFRGTYVSADVAQLENVARSLGASPWQQLTRVAAPVLLRMNAATFGLLFVSIFGAYEIPQLLGRQSPQMLAVLVMGKFARFDITEKPQAYAVAVVYAVAVSMVVGVAMRPRRRT